MRPPTPRPTLVGVPVTKLGGTGPVLTVMAAVSTALLALEPSDMLLSVPCSTAIGETARRVRPIRVNESLRDKVALLSPSEAVARRAASSSPCDALVSEDDSATWLCLGEGKALVLFDPAERVVLVMGLADTGAADEPSVRSADRC